MHQWMSAFRGKANLGASNQREIDAAFAMLVREQAAALLTNSESLFMVHGD